VKRESKIEPIQPAEMPSFADAHADRALTMAKMLGFSPDAAWGLPGSGSGTDRGLQLQPLLEYTAMKQLNWQAALQRLFRMVYQMVESKTTGTVTYRGSRPTGRGRTPKPYAYAFGPGAQASTAITDDPLMGAAEVELPNTPKELFDGDYSARFVWRNRVDPEDPQYVASEINRFQSGIQSLETTLENLGIQAPEDEMRRIEKEAERFPWINDGRVALLIAQMRGNAQGQGGGPAPDTSLNGAMDTFGSTAAGGESGSLNADALFGAIPGGTGIPYGGA
jgi:hypothetical protein